MLLEHVDRAPGGLDEEVLLARGEPQELEPLLQLGVVQGLLVLLLPHRAGGPSRSPAAPSGDPEDSGAKDPKVGELVQARKGNVQRLASSHGQARHRTVLSVRQHSVVLLDERHDVIQEIFEELIRLRPRGVRAPAKAERARVTGGHGDHHRLGLPGRDQVIQDEACSTHGCPRIVAIERAVQEIEDGELSLA